MTSNRVKYCVILHCHENMKIYNLHYFKKSLKSFEQYIFCVRRRGSRGGRFPNRSGGRRSEQVNGPSKETGAYSFLSSIYDARKNLLLNFS